MINSLELYDQNDLGSELFLTNVNKVVQLMFCTLFSSLLKHNAFFCNVHS